MTEQASPAQQIPNPPPAEEDFQIRNIYTKDISFETPNSPHIFNSQEGLSIGMELGNKAQQLEDTLYEVTLTITITAKSGDKTAYLVEVNQAGIFGLSTSYNDEERGWFLGVYCPKLLFPYARQVIGDLVLKGGFPPLILAPVNFDAIYHDIRQRQMGDGAAGHA